MKGNRFYLLTKTQNENITDIFHLKQVTVNINWDQKKIIFKGKNEFTGFFENVKKNYFKIDKLNKTKLLFNDSDLNLIENFLEEFFQKVFTFTILSNKIFKLANDTDFIIMKIE